MKKEINEFPYRSKKYRTRYLDELAKLYKDAEHGKDEEKPAGEGGTDPLC
jgi:hypothetical protein